MRFGLRRPSLRKSIAAKAALIIAFAATASLAQAQEGKLRVCRYPPSAVAADDRARIPIPVGSVFTSGDNQATGDQLKPYFTVVTTQDAVLPPKPGCVLVSAKMGENPEGFTLTRRYPTFLPSQIVSSSSIVGRVVGDFK